jgi:2-polyprenyl-6-methoxyphenol hydroxylase-like FAD-dependent oxidoreductase
MSEVFTDVDGKFHHGTVPRGLVRPEQWRKLQERAEEMLPEGLAAIVRATRTPFLTKIYEVAATKASFMKGKVFLVGDAQVTLRPNIAMSSTHAAVDCNELEKVIEGTSTSEQWEGAVLKWGAAQRRFAMTISAYGLGTWPSVAWNGMCWLGLLAGQRLGML